MIKKIWNFPLGEWVGEKNGFFASITKIFYYAVLGAMVLINSPFWGLIFCCSVGVIYLAIALWEHGFPATAEEEKKLLLKIYVKKEFKMRNSFAYEPGAKVYWECKDYHKKLRAERSSVENANENGCILFRAEIKGKQKMLMPWRLLSRKLRNDLSIYRKKITK